MMDDYCRECQMPGEPGAYHPYAACLMFKQCRNSETVHANLQAVLQHAQHRKKRAA